MNEKHQPRIIAHDELMIDPECVRNIERKTFAMIQNKRRQVGRMRWVVAIAWGLFVVILIVGSLIETTAGHGALTSSIAMAARALLVISLFLTGSWYVRSVYLRFDTIQQALSAIQDRLGELPHTGSDTDGQ